MYFDSLLQHCGLNVSRCRFLNHFTSNGCLMFCMDYYYYFKPLSMRKVLLICLVAIFFPQPRLEFKFFPFHTQVPNSQVSLDFTTHLNLHCYTNYQQKCNQMHSPFKIQSSNLLPYPEIHSEIHLFSQKS